MFNFASRVFVAVLILYEIGKIQEEIGKGNGGRNQLFHLNLPMKAIQHLDLDTVTLIS